MTVNMLFDHKKHCFGTKYILSENQTKRCYILCYYMHRLSYS